jgi:YVTN family beta-propeller protein
MRTLHYGVGAVLAAAAMVIGVAPASAASRPPARLVTSGRQLTVTATIPVGATPNAIDQNPYTNRVYVANEDSNSVSVISGRTDTVIATIPVGADPFTLAVNPLSNKIYVGSLGTGTVSVISGKKNVVIATIKVQAPVALAVDPLTGLVWVADGHVTGRVFIVSMRTDKIIGTVKVGRAPAGIAVNPLTNRVYVADAFSDTVSVISGRTRQVIATVPVGDDPQPIAVNPVTNKIYVTSDGPPTAPQPGTLQVISGKTSTVTASMAADTFGLSVDPYDNLIYAVNASTVGEAHVISGKTNQTISSVNVGAVPYGIVIEPITNVAYAAVTGDNTVAVLRWRKAS